MNKTKYTEEIKNEAIKLRLEGKSNPEITAITGMKHESLNKLFKERGVKLTEEQAAAARARRWLDHEPIVEGKKICSKCGKLLPLSDFHKNKNRLSGAVSSCKSCYKNFYEKNAETIKQRVSVYNENNKEKRSKTSSLYYEKNKEKITKRTQLWIANNPEKRKVIEKKFQKKYQPIKNANTSQYRAQKALAMPKWLSLEDCQKIGEIYKNCPSGSHVDHIVPICGENVCGLHVPWNLQYLTAFQNESKGNNFQTEIKVGACHQFQRKLDTKQEDILNGAPINTNLSEFDFGIENFDQEHRAFIERYEWLGTMGYSPKWIFTARHKGLLGGMVVISEPNSYTKDVKIEALVSRGATASWTPKNLGSKLVMFACRYMVKNTNKRVFFGYSDHSAGEIGTIYQACNFKYLGQNFGCKTIYKTVNGKVVNSRYFRKTSTFRRYAKELDIMWESSWSKPNKYMDIKAIPVNVLKALKEKGKQEMETCIPETQSPKGKYVLILGFNAKEQRIISDRYNKIFGEYISYPKRTV